MKRAFLPFCLSIFCLPFLTNAQPSRDWDKTIGSQNWDELHVVLPMDDGGFLLGGNITAAGGEVSQPVFGLNDFWVVRTDADGNVIWDKVFGGSGNDRLWSILPLSEGGYLVGGTSDSDVSGNKTTPNRGEEDFWLLKISADGEKIWERTYGGAQEDQLFIVRQFQDGNFLLGGWSASGISGEKTADSLGIYDVWALKINDLGEILWQRTLGGDRLDNLYDATPTPDGGMLLGCASASGQTLTKTSKSKGWADFWIVKIDADGNAVWDNSFGGNDVEQLEQILPLRDGNYLLVGASMSQLSGDRTTQNFGGFDFWAVKISPEGQKIWDKAFGGNKFDGAFKVVETLSGNLLLVGASDSPVSGTKKTPNLGGYDYWLVKADKNGNQVWEKTYGGNNYDAATEIVQMNDGSLLLAGHSNSATSAYKTENPRGHNDFWLLKTYCNVKAKLPEDGVFCSGDEIPLEVSPENCAGGGCEIFWSNGQSGEAILLKVDSLASVSVLAEDLNTCVATDTLYYKVLPSPSAILPPDTSIFKDGGELFLNVFQENATFDWNIGDQTPFVTVTKSGNYAVTVTADNGCTASDDINVCACDERLLFIPNVFQPDGDIFNDTWFVQSKPGAIEEIELLEIYDRWGHRVFRTEHAMPNSKTFGWDGYDRGLRCVPGVYTFAMRVRFSAVRSETLFGTVTLIR